MPPRRTQKPLRSLLQRLRADQAGGVVALIAFAAPVILGGLAAGVETGMWYVAKRQTQQQADTSALAAARAKSTGTTDYPTLSQIALRDAERNGFSSVSPNTIVIGDPPTSGAFTGFTNTVQATVTMQAPLVFSKYFMSVSSITITARAVAGTQSTTGSGNGCIMALDMSASSAVQFNGSVNASLASCTIVANSNDASAVKFNGAVSVAANSIYTRGGVVQIGAVTVTLTTPAATNQSTAILDPYANSGIPPLNACSQTNFSLSGGGSTNISPGVYCNGLSIGGHKTVNMTPGTYYIDQGDFKMTGNTSLTCTGCTNGQGVTIVLTSSTGSNIGTFDLAGTTMVDIKAPSGVSEPFRGIAIYQDRRATSGAALKLTGTSASKYTGAVYAPSSPLQFAGNAALTTGRKCLQLIGKTVTFSGNPKLDISECDSYGAKPISTNSLQLRLLE